ncbi:succinate dehydrogenase cytochrome b subunit [uncultured Kriegella sp.]|uniref:succinate dehydrogenase cytochrome b subunit n=1 Tax=uncultured Kriegella sp. TaxID=1798910 RepID=UPI0030D9ED5D|tara:strand:+ start:70519 stop:71184 length:666 start_codon:yes stop_codon:yes gene_type:complete
MWYVKNALTRKNLMALTGLFLSFFLIIHLFGNLQLLLPGETARVQYNWYSHLLADNIIVKVIALVLYLCILLHTIDAIYLTLKSKKANGSGYAKDKRGRASKWYSRNMMFLGSIVFLFLIIHFKDFWYQFKFGELALDEHGNKDLYTLVIEAFDQLWYVMLYVVAIIALGYHLMHGVFSAYRTLGLYHPIYSKIVKFSGMAYALIMTVGYIIIPIYIYLNH